jgi:hypothetical protein
MSKFVETNERIAGAVVQGYKKIEDGVVGGYKKMENSVVTGFNKVTDKCVEVLFAKDGETVELQFSLRRIYRLLFGAGVNFEIYDGTQILFFVPEEKRSAVQWYMASMILHDEAVAD